MNNRQNSARLVVPGINDLCNRNFDYTAGYPEPGRNWFFNLKYQF